MKEQPSVPIKIRLTAARSVYIIFGVIFGILFLLALLATVIDVQAFNGLFIIVFVWLLIYWTFHKYELILADNLIIYCTPFGGTKIVEVSEIKAAILDYRSESHKDSLEPPLKLRIEAKSGNSKDRFIIHAKIFDREELNNFLQVTNIPIYFRKEDFV